MQYRRLGKTGLQVSLLGLGCGRLGSVGQTGGNEAALRLIGTALDSGINFFDTSDIYGQGASEKLLGQVLRGREKIVIATKAGFCLSGLGGAASRLKPLLRKVLRVVPGFAGSIQKVRAAQNRQDFSADYLTKCAEASLSRLGVDALDVFLLHSPPTEILERGDAFETLEKLRKTGKARHCGVSCRNTSDVALCLKHPVISVLQVELGLLTPDAIEQTVLAARSADVGIMARRVLAGGVILRSSGELRPEDATERGEDFARLRNRHERLEKIASENGMTLPEMALHSLFQFCEISSVLIGTTRTEHLREHLKVLDRPWLRAEETRRILAAVRA